MATYKELLAEREKLEKQISEARKAEVGEAVAKIRALMKDFDLSIKDIEPNRAADKRKKLNQNFVTLRRGPHGRDGQTACLDQRQKPRRFCN